MLRKFIALGTGLMFGMGLMISQMANPQKILNFLDITGNWDPSLILVMVGALVVYGLGYWKFIYHHSKSLLGDALPQPPHARIDGKLIIGAATFGVGWGVAGLCPGPSIVNLASGDIKIIAFVAVMILGMKVGSITQKIWS